MGSHEFSQLRVGIGHDTHRVTLGRPLIIGGVEIDDAEFGLDGHSDADVLIHAVIDAILGASGLGDIGEWFPDSSECWKDADSSALLSQVLGDVQRQGWRILNMDCTIHAERPRLTLWKSKIRSRMANLLAVASECINVKAKSGEKVGPVGRCESIEAEAVILLAK